MGGHLRSPNSFLLRLRPSSVVLGQATMAPGEGLLERGRRMNRSGTRALESPPAPIKRRPSFHHLPFQAAELDLTFKLAETRDEREQAFQVLHDMYVRRGLIDPLHASMVQPGVSSLG